MRLASIYTHLVFSLAFGSGVAAAQQSGPVATFQTEVIVTAERGSEDRDRLGVSTAVLTREELGPRPAVNLAEAIPMLPGFHLVSSHASGLPPTTIARGFFGGGEAEYVTLLVDGIPVNDVESGVAEWRAVPVLAIDRVEALRGPASALYGDTALGGVIQVFTIRPRGRAGRATVMGGTFGTASAGAEVSQPLGRVALHALGSYDRSDGFRAHGSRDEAFATLSLHGAAPSPRWTARTSWTYVDRDEPGALTQAQLLAGRDASDPIFRFDRHRTRRAYGAFRYGAAEGPFAYSVLAHVSRRNGDRLRTLLLAPGLGDRAARDATSGTSGASVENTLRMSVARATGQLRFGGDLSRDHLETGYAAVSSAGAVGPDVGALSGDRWRIAGYVTQSLDLGSRARLQAGLRWDGLRDGMDDRRRVVHESWSPRAGGTLALGGGTALFAQVSRAFKAPTLDQLFDPRPFPDFRGGTFLISSPTLRPQRAASGEAGVRQSGARFRWEAVFYRMRVRDEIDFDPATFSYGNIGRSRHDGVELDAAVFRGAPLSVAVNYAWTRVVPDVGGDGDTRQLKNVPRHLLRPELTILLPGRVTVHARFTQSAGAYADDANRVPLGNRSTVDLRVAKSLARLTARLDLLNVTSDRYEEVGFVLPDFRGGLAPFYYPAPGFALRAGVDVTF